jgi:hypothetical protein
MSEDRDLMIARALAADYGLSADVDDSYLLTIIAAVDASLGGVEQGAVTDCGQPPELSAKAAAPAVVAATNAQAAEPQGDDIVWPDTKIVTTVNPYANGYREAKSEAVGLMRDVAWYPDVPCWCGDEYHDPRNDTGYVHEATCLAAAKYIAAFEAEQEKGE